MAEFNSKHGSLAIAPSQAFMMFADLRNFGAMVPEDKKEMAEFDYDTVKVNVQGFQIGVRVSEREPYSLIALEDDGAPFSFRVELHFDEASSASETDFHIDVQADLNFMMKMMLGGKIKDALDKIVDTFSDATRGHFPEGFNPEEFLKKNSPYQA